MDKNISTIKKHISPGQLNKSELESILSLTETHVTFCIGNMEGQHITVHCLYEHGFRRIIDLQSSSEKLSGQRKQCKVYVCLVICQADLYERLFLHTAS